MVNGNAYDDALTLLIDGRRPVSADLVSAVAALCDRADDHDGTGPVVVHVTGAPDASWAEALTVGLANKWERALRRLERLGRLTVAAASGDCGGAALEALLATDIRLARPGTRLLPPVVAGAAWPGMALHRLAQQAGTAPVRRAVLLGAPITAARARELSLVDEVTDDPASALAVLAEQAAGLAGGELAIRRRLLLDAATTPFDEALGAHLAACDRALRRSAP